VGGAASVTWPAHATSEVHLRKRRLAHAKSEAQQAEEGLPACII